MKKILFAIIAMCVSSASFAERTVAFTPITSATAGTTVDATIEITNTDYDVLGVGFEFVLPEGFSIKVKSNGTISATNLSKIDTRLQEDAEEETPFTTFGASAVTADGITTYSVNAIGIAYITGTNGPVFGVKLIIAETVAPGVYPITIKNAKLVKKSGADSVDGLCSTSYVVVGTPSNATLALEGSIPSFVNTALTTETAISTLDLTKVTASNGKFTYVAGRDVIKPTADVTADVVISAPAPTGTYASICAPYALDLNCYTYTSTSGSTANFASATSLAANTPAIVNAAVNVEKTGVTLAGVAKQNITSGNYLKGDKFLTVSGNATIPALRGAWNLGGGVKSFTIDGETVGINGIDADETETIYNTAGVRMNKAQRGVNIINGKKVVVK